MMDELVIFLRKLQLEMDYDTLTEEDMAWMNYYFELDWMTHCILLDATFLRTIPFADRICFLNGIEAAYFAENILTCLLLVMFFDAGGRLKESGLHSAKLLAAYIGGLYICRRKGDMQGPCNKEEVSSRE
jgi:hypothetical protein